jgi:hypothetical protein
MTMRKCLGGNGCEAPSRKVDAVTTKATGQEEEEEEEEGVVMVVEKRRIAMMF